MFKPILNLKNFILRTDSYKFGHFKQYRKGTQFVYSYFESRGGKFDKVVFFGLQFYLKEYLSGVVVTKEDIAQAKSFVTSHLGSDKNFNEAGWNYIVEKHGGKLPISIRAVKEGTPVKYSNALMVLVNTDPECYWLTQYIEGLIQKIWYTCTVATFSREMKKLLFSYYEKATSYTKEEILSVLAFMLHDFGYRSASSEETAGLGGMAHLLNFKGTDTVRGILYGQAYYNTTAMLGYSVNATEHSTVTSWGRENEVKAYKHFIEQFPDGILSVVSDSYDILNAVENIYGVILKDDILAREGRFVVRPDSGDPTMTLRMILPILFDKMGGTVNAKGYKVLNDKVRIIQGDGVNYDSVKKILDMLIEIGFSPENVVFGCGTVLLQNHNRDTHKFAIKCCAVTTNGKFEMIEKDPTEIDENGNKIKSFKKSKKGELKLVKDMGIDELGEALYRTINNEDPHFGSYTDMLEEVFRDGEILKEYTFEDCIEAIAIAA